VRLIIFLPTTSSDGIALRTSFHSRSFENRLTADFKMATEEGYDTTPTSNNTREAQFLEGRAARLEAIHGTTIENSNQATKTHRKIDSLNEFWNTFRQEVNEWKSRLEELEHEATAIEIENSNTNADEAAVAAISTSNAAASNPSGSNSPETTLAAPPEVSKAATPSATRNTTTPIHHLHHQRTPSVSERRTHLRIASSDLQAELEELRKHCLNSFNATAASSSTLSSNPVMGKYDNWEIPEDFPLADLRLLHTEFTNCAEQLEATRNSLLPKAKFVFHRYRKAKLLLQQQQEQKETTQADTFEESKEEIKESYSDGDNQATSNDSSLPKDHFTQDDNDNSNPLENQSHASINVFPDGEVQISQTTTEAVADVQEDKDEYFSVAGELSLVIRNIQHSTITLYVSKFNEMKRIIPLARSVQYACDSLINSTSSSSVQTKFHDGIAHF
jgi:hypothetical protein